MGHFDVHHSHDASHQSTDLDMYLEKQREGEERHKIIVKLKKKNPIEQNGG